MLSALKHRLPSPVRSALRRVSLWGQWAKAAMADMTSGPRPKRVPPQRHVFIGGGDFAAVGDHFLGTLQTFGLTPDMNVLDVGCGQGRMARPLTGYLSNSGSYTGFDIVKKGIVWCQDEYADMPNFTFLHADIYNDRYNRSGTYKAAEYKFPFDDNQFDFIFLTSVFTHMFSDDMENYLSEIARVLKPGGRSLITWFLIDDTAKAAVADKSAAMDFHHKLDAVTYTTVPDMPEAATGFDAEYVKALYAKLGLNVSDIHPGKWARPDTGRDYQDIVIADKTA